MAWKMHAKSGPLSRWGSVRNKACRYAQDSEWLFGIKKCGSPHQQSHQKLLKKSPSPWSWTVHYHAHKTLALDTILCHLSPVHNPCLKEILKEKNTCPWKKKIYLIFIYLLTKASYLVKDIIALSNVATNVKLSLDMARQHIRPMRYRSMHS